MKQKDKEKIEKGKLESRDSWRYRKEECSRDRELTRKQNELKLREMKRTTQLLRQKGKIFKKD